MGPLKNGLFRVKGAALTPWESDPKRTHPPSNNVFGSLGENPRFSGFVVHTLISK